MTEHGWTRHGHRCCDQATGPRPAGGVARCGGPALCRNCAADAAIRHPPGSGTFAAPTSPSEPERPEGLSAVREEWRVTGSTNGPYAIDDGPWERIYTDREAAVWHFGFLGRADPTCARTLARRTVTTYTGEWVEETNDAD
mgnify:CR=1 FL=1